MTSVQRPRLFTKNYILISLANLLMAVGFYFLIPTLPVFITSQLGAGPGMVGYIIAVYTLSAMLIRPLTGYLVDSYGRKWIYIVSFFAFAAMLGFYTLVYSLIWLLVLRFMHGFTWGATTTSASTIIVDMIPPSRRGEGIGIYGLSFTVAMALAPAVALAIMGTDDFETMFLSAMAIALAGFALMLLVKFPEYSKPVTKTVFKLSGIIEPRTLPMAGIQLLYGLTYGGLMSFITLYAKEYRIDQPELFFGLFAVGIAVSRLVSGRFFDLRGPAILVLTGLLAGAVGFAALGLFVNITGFLLAAILVGVCMGIVMPTLQTMANNVVEPQKRGAANATFITAFDIGIGGGSMLLGIVAEFSSLKTMYIVSAMILVVSVVLYFGFVQGFYERKRIVGGDI